jgi:signal transduction histidine kinase
MSAGDPAGASLRGRVRRLPGLRLPWAPSRPHPRAAWTLAVAGPVLITFATLPFRSTIGTAGVLFCILLAVVATGVLGGVRPALLAVLLGYLFAVFFLASPYLDLRAATPGDFVALIAFAVVGGSVGILVDNFRRVAEEQAALRRVATLVAQAAPQDQVFAAVVEEVGRLLRVDLTAMGRYLPSEKMTFVADWARGGEPPLPVGIEWNLGGTNVSSLVAQTGRPARIDNRAEFTGALAAVPVETMRSDIGAPIMVAGHLWGVMIVGTKKAQPLPRDTEARLAGFTDLVATAISNAEALSQLRELLNEQAALRRVATLVAHGVDQQTLFTAVAEEIGRLAGGEMVNLFRYEPDGTATRVAVWTTQPSAPPVGESIAASGHYVFAKVLETRAPVRLDDLSVVTGRAADIVREHRMRSAVASPIMVDGQLWGAAGTGTTKSKPFPEGTEERIAGFTELVATAISNANARSELAASRARVVAASDATRRRIERDLHDGIQQGLVTLALGVRGAIDSVPAEMPELATQLDQMVISLQELLEEVRKISRGLHPAILSEAGLGPALKSLARRSAVPVELEVRLDGRLPPTIEVAAYYIVSEALTNTAKHANASVAKVTVEKRDGLVRVQVSDDGSGGADPGRGSGLVGLTDRVEALGGKIVLSSAPGEGTTMIAALPTP